jgi:hypothetical protein
MPSTDRKLELKAKTSVAQTGSQPYVYAKGLTVQGDGSEGHWSILVGESASKLVILNVGWQGVCGLVSGGGGVYFYWGAGSSPPSPPHTSNSDVRLHLVMIAGSEVICGFWSPKMFVNFSKSHYLYFMRFNFFLRGHLWVQPDCQSGPWLTKVKNP